MTFIERRKFVASMASVAVCAGVVPSLAHASSIAPMADQQFGSDDMDEPKDWWFMGRRCRLGPALGAADGRFSIEFWSMPFCELDYTSVLPPEIPRWWLSYENSDWPELRSAERVVVDCDDCYDGYRVEWPEGPIECAYHWAETKTLASTLRILIGDNAPNSRQPRTALIALDSLCPTGPGWDEVIPALAPCYERIIGHHHIDQGSFREWKEWLDSISDPEETSFFKHVWSGASQCDAVIVTTVSNPETEAEMPAVRSIETFARERVGRVGPVIIEGRALSQIAAETLALY